MNLPPPEITVRIPGEDAAEALRASFAMTCAAAKLADGLALLLGGLHELYIEDGLECDKDTCPIVAILAYWEARPWKGQDLTVPTVEAGE